MIVLNSENRSTDAHLSMSFMCGNLNLLTDTSCACRYEVNPDMVPELEAAGLRFVGKDETGQRMEIIELPTSVHPFFLAVQYHPEFKSRPLKPSPPFVGLIAAACGKLDLAYKHVSKLHSTPKKKAADLGLALM